MLSSVLPALSTKIAATRPNSNYRRKRIKDWLPNSISSEFRGTLQSFHKWVKSFFIDPLVHPTFICRVCSMLICVLTNLGSAAFFSAQQRSRWVSSWEMPCNECFCIHQINMQMLSLSCSCHVNTFFLLADTNSLLNGWFPALAISHIEIFQQEAFDAREPMFPSS